MKDTAKKGVVADGVVGLRGRAVTLWREVQMQWALDPAGLELLRLACEAMSRAEECADVVNREGASFRDKWGQPKAHPIALLERDHRAQAARHLAALGVSLEAE
jgi:P27 family predicted phage terminase small subunit